MPIPGPFGGVSATHATRPESWSGAVVFGNQTSNETRVPGISRKSLRTKGPTRTRRSRGGASHRADKFGRRYSRGASSGPRYASVVLISNPEVVMRTSSILRLSWAPALAMTLFASAACKREERADRERTRSTETRTESAQRGAKETAEEAKKAHERAGEE